jgi:hypothetical protein
MPRHRGKTMKKRAKTHARAKSEQKTLTIPELRKSLDYVTQYTSQLVKSGAKSTKEMATAFAEEWQKVFGATLDMKTAESYIRHVMSRPVFGSKGTRRKMRGGAALAGAPLDFLTRPGEDLPYGNFLKYIDSGFWNPEPATYVPNGTLPPAGMGSNRMSGGGVMDAVSSMIFRPFVATNPTSIPFDAATAWSGQPLGPGPEVTAQAWKLQPVGQAVITPGLNIYPRMLSSDVTTR